MKKTKRAKEAEEALRKKALGYRATEVVEEYGVSENGAVELTKRRVTEKDVPPDLAALKTYLEYNSTPSEFSGMSINELLAEREKLLSELKTCSLKGENNGTKKTNKKT